MSRESQPRKKRKVIPIICRVLGIIFILAVIVTALPLTIPKLLGYEIFNVESGSMEPEIPVGSVIYVKPTPPEDIQENDIITFSKEGVTVTHRVIENHIVEGEFVTKGDATEKEDVTPVPYASLVRKVTAHFAVLGKFLVVYSSTIGKVYVLLVAACGVMLNILGSMLKRN